MSTVREAPKSNKTIRKLREKAASSENFCNIVTALQEVAVEHCASDNLMRQALALALHEQAWNGYRLHQGAMVDGEEIAEDEGEDDEGVV